MRTREAEAIGIVAAIGALTAVGVVKYKKIVRKEQAKRKSIKEWEAMNLEATAAAIQRIEKLASDPNTTAKDILKAWREETQFMNLINDQPMY